MNTLIISLIVGLIAGWLAGLLYKGSGFGMIGNIIVGLIGSVVGRFLAGLIGVSADNILGTTLIAVGGAIVLLFVINLFTGKKKVLE